MQDSRGARGEGGQDGFKMTWTASPKEIINEFSEELLAHRCGISDGVFEGE